MKKPILSFLLVLFATILAVAQELPSSVTWSNILAHPAPLPVVGEMPAVRSDLSKPSWWSVGCECMDRDYACFDKFKQYVGQTGVGYARLQSGWAKTEKKKGKYDFAWLDEHVDGLIKQGVHPWMCLCYGNPLYSEHGFDLNAKLFPDGPIMDAWLRYVKAVVSRYKGKVTMYEVWNEPDNKRALDSYDLYANLYVRTSQVIRETDPDVKIAALGACSPENPYIRQALSGIRDAGGIDRVDYITYHAYWQYPEMLIPYVQKLAEDVKAFSPSIRLLQGETGCPGELDFGHAMHSIEWTEYSQAKWDLRSMLIHWSLGCPHSVFTMTDLNYGWMIQSFGLIRTNLKGEPVYLRPKFHAVRHITSLITYDVTPNSSVTVQSACGHRIQCVGLEKNGKIIGCALWMADRRPGDSLERELVSLSIKGLQIPVDKVLYVDLLTGYVHSLPELARYRGLVVNDGLNFGSLPLWDSPIVLINQDEYAF